MKIKLQHVQKLGLLVEAGCEEYVLLVDGGEVLPVRVGVFFHQAQYAALVGRVEVGVVRGGFPYNGYCHS